MPVARTEIDLLDEVKAQLAIIGKETAARRPK
jgi:hypothetical protein